MYVKTSFSSEPQTLAEIEEAVFALSQHGDAIGGVSRGRVVAV